MLLPPGTAAEAREEVERIGRHVAAAEPHALGLFDGTAGDLLLLATCTRHNPVGALRDAAAALARRLTQALVDGIRRPSVADGEAGVWWALASLSAAGWMDASSVVRARAGRVCRIATVMASQGVLDPIYGAVGSARALLDVDAERGGDVAAAVIAALHRVKVPLGPGVAFLMPRADGVGTRVDLGRAHGAVGVLGFLVEAASHGVPDAEPLACAVVEGLLHAASWGPEGARVPSWLDAAGAPHYVQDLAWCYGELTVADALDASGLALAKDAWRAAAARIGVGVAQRPPARPAPRDAASVCHGAAGVLRLFLRLGARGSEPRLVAAAHAWLERTLGEQRRDAHRAGLLTGAAGVGLALLDGLGLRTHRWDALL